MWYRWTKLTPANIPENLRAEFEAYGGSVVAQIVGRPYTHDARQTVGVPLWAEHREQRQQAMSWLREKFNEAQRRHDINEAMEMAILIFVAVEAIPIIHDGIKWLTK